MSDTLITIVAIMLVAVLMFIFPLITMADRVDTASRTEVETMTSNFINEIRTTGKLTQDKYSKFLENLTSTGYTYDVNLEFKILDENSGKKGIQVERDKIGENVYYSVFTTQIEDELERNGVYLLKEGDIVLANIKNTNLTLKQQMEEFLYSIVGADIYTIQASQSGMVTVTGIK